MTTEYIILQINGIFIRGVVNSANEDNKRKNRKLTAKYINDADRYGSVTSIAIAENRDGYVNGFKDKSMAAARWGAMPEVVWTKK